MSECTHPHDLQSFVDGEVHGAEAARIREHLKHCEACASRVEAYEQVRYTLLRSRRVRPAEDLLQRILGLLRRVSPVRRLSCREARVLASAYIDDELSRDERETLETHLFACDACFAEYAQMREAAGIMRATPSAEAAEGLKRRILAAVAEEAEPTPMLRPVRRGAPSWYRALGPSLAAAAVVVFAFGVFQLSGGIHGQSEAPSEVVAVATPHTPVETVAPEPVEPPAPAVEVAPEAPAEVEPPAAAPAAVTPSDRRPGAETTGQGGGPADSGAPTATREPARTLPPADGPRPVRPATAPTAIASVGRTEDRAAAAARGGDADARSRLASTDRSRSEPPGGSRTTAPHVTTPTPLRGPSEGGSEGAPRLTRPEPRPMLAQLEETSEDGLQPKEWVEKRPETATRLYSYSGDNGRRLADVGSNWTRGADTGGDSRPGLSDEVWPTN